MDKNFLIQYYKKLAEYFCYICGRIDRANREWFSSEVVTGADLQCGDLIRFKGHCSNCITARFLDEDSESDDGSM